MANSPRRLAAIFSIHVEAKIFQKGYPEPKFVFPSESPPQKLTDFTNSPRKPKKIPPTITAEPN